MFDHSRITRLATIALAACAVTWAFAGVASAQPYPANDDAGGAPAYKAVVVDSDKAPAATPSSRISAGDVNKAPNPAQVQRVLDTLPGKSAPPQPAVDGGGNDDTGTIALVVAIAAILTALAAMTMTVTRSHRPVLRH
jgi:hypothetical protein